MAKGVKTGGGSRKGRPNKATAERIAKERESGLMPLDYMLTVLRDPNSTEDHRRWAAKESAPYLHAKLTSTELKQDKPFIHEVRWSVSKS